MFAEQLKMGDGAKIKLDCAHQFTGGEMKCSNCGQYPTIGIQNQVVDCSAIDWHNSIEYLKTHDI